MAFRDDEDAALQRSPLELLLPEGAADAALVLGDDCPPALDPGRGGAGPVDLVVLAPSRIQRRDRGWLESAAGEAAARLSEAGIAYAVPGGAAPLRRALVDAGLPRTGSVLHVPRTERPRYLVPIGTPAERYALSGGIPLSRSKRLAASLSGSSARARLGPSGGIHRRLAAAPLAAWLFGLGDGAPAGSVLVARPRAGSLLAYRFGDGSEPDAIAKVSRAATDETRALLRIAPGAAEAGARVPDVLASGQLASVPFVLESALPGRRAADLVRGGDVGADELQARLAGWLLQWNRRSAAVRPLVAADVERFLLAPAARAGVHAAYVDHLQALGARAIGRACPFVPVHGDLTLANVLVDGPGPLGVVDWEHAEEDALPLTDLLYAGVDAVAARRGYENRPDAFAACFDGDTQLGRLAQEAAGTLGLDEALQTVCFHACWLHHAANETAAGSPGGPFSTILRTVASAR